MRPAPSDDDKYAKFANQAPLKVVPPPINAPLCNDDDKYAKCGSAHKHVPEPLQKYSQTLGLLGGTIDTIPWEFLAFASFVLASGLWYLSVGLPFSRDKVIRFSSSNMEILGLLMLRHKIKVRQSVCGISGMTIAMYAAVYLVRMWLSLPDTLVFEWRELDFDATFGSVSFLLVLSILKSVFVTHRSTYQSDLDVLKVQYLIPGCWATAALVRLHFSAWSAWYGYTWCSCMYMDVLALMPQIVMMARGDGKVEAPIAHFVAATFISRIGDLENSLMELGHLSEREPFSYWGMVSLQALHLLLVVDFMWYYMKARASATRLLDDLTLADDVC